MTRSIAVLGVPTSAGSHHAGQDLAPAALRAHRLIERLRENGCAVEDLRDLPGSVFRPDPDGLPARNLDAVVRVANEVAETVARESDTERLLLVLGGDCTIELGVVAGLQRRFEDVRVAYFDGDADLNAPDRTRSGILDASGVAHLLGIADTPLARLGPRFPALRPDQLALIGSDPTDPDSYDATALAARPDLLAFTDADVRDDPAAVLASVRDGLQATAGVTAVHFDVDAIDSGELPLGNFPHYGTGVPVPTAQILLRGLLALEGVVTLTLTEVNPTYDPSGESLDRYLDLLVTALTAAVVGAGPR